MAFLSLRNLSKFYGSNQVVRSISLAVEKGEFVSLLGPSGCGKTTCLQMIAGFVDVSGGRIELDGRDITDQAPNTRGLGIVFQTYALFPHMTVEENICFGLEMRQCPRAEIARKVARAVDLVKLVGYEKRFPRELSGGQRQRVALARALVIEPAVLLLDEPLSNLDAKLREEMQFELRRIQRSIGTTTIMVTHDQNEAMSVSDRVIVMKDGAIIQADKPFSVYESPRSEFVSTFVGKSNLIPGFVVDSGAISVIELTGFPHIRVEAPQASFRPGSAILFSLRPEKVRIVAAGEGRIRGQVGERFFMGNHWLYRIKTPVGEILSLCSNDGSLQRDEGETVDVDWHESSARLLPAALANEAEAVA